MAPSAVPDREVLALALAGRPPREVLRAAERDLMARRAAPPDVAGCCAEALALVAGKDAEDGPTRATALAIARAADRHGAGFPSGKEPPYHDRHHQAEATLAMGWLAGFAHARGWLDRRTALLAVAAMAGHDLLHDGSAGGPRGALEERSVEATAAIGRAHGLDEAGIALIARIIRATTWPWAEADAPDLACRLAREADLFGSILPCLGPRLARRLAVELAMAGQPDADAVASHAARLGLLRQMQEPSPAAVALGLGWARERQIAAYGAVAQRLGVQPPLPEAGATSLDAMDEADAAALLAHAAAAA
jgi:hypothetical protein